jgi:hypothetical protein
MKRTTIAGMATAAIVAGGLGLADLGPAGIAQADPGGPHNWCPGESMDYSPTAAHFNTDTGPGAGYHWDMNICHTWYRLRDEKGNVPYGLNRGSLPSDVWDGTNPPAGSLMGPPPPCPPSILPCL